MTDTSGYRIRPRWFDDASGLADSVIVTHDVAGCQETLLVTESVSVHTLTDLAARHSVNCSKHGT